MTEDGSNGLIGNLTATANTYSTMTDTRLIGQESETLTGIEGVILTGGDGNNITDASSFSTSVTIFGLLGKDTLNDGKNNNLLIPASGTNFISREAGYDFLNSTNNNRVSLSDIRLQNLSNSAELSNLSNMEAVYLLGKSFNDFITVNLLIIIIFLLTRLLKD